MKKTYLRPYTELSQMLEEEILAISNSITSSGLDETITYGGVDEGGLLDPSVKEELLGDF